MRNHNQDLKVQDITWIQKMIAGPEEADGLDWVDEDELTGEEIKDISQLSAFGVTEQSLKEFKKYLLNMALYIKVRNGKAVALMISP